MPTNPTTDAGPRGIEWIVDASGCSPDALRQMANAIALTDDLVASMTLHPVGAPLAHQFGGEGGITILVLLSESHLAVHTFPEAQAITVNLYCCRSRPAPDWTSILARRFGAAHVLVRTLPRGAVP